jgi:hypothetical protein
VSIPNIKNYKPEKRLEISSASDVDRYYQSIYKKPRQLVKPNYDYYYTNNSLYGF